MSPLGETARIAGVLAGIVVLLAGAWLATASIVGLVNDRSHLQQQVAILGRQRHTSTPHPAPTVTVTAPRGPSSPVASATPGGTPPAAAPVAQVSVPGQTGGGPQGGGGGGGNPPGGPQPTPTHRLPGPAACGTPAIVTVSAPVGVLPCNAVTVRRVARVGGTGGPRPTPS